MRILYLATREPSYPRVAMTLRSLRELGEVEAIVCRSSSYLLRLLVTAFRFMFSRRSSYDVVFVGFFAQPILPLVRLFWRGPLVTDAFISLYDSLVLDKGLSRKGTLVARLALWLDRFCILRSDAVVVDTLGHKELFESYLEGEAAPPIVRMWASADELVFEPLKGLDYNLEQDDLFEVLFWGGFIPLQGVEVIVRAVAYLDRKRIRVTLVGSGQSYKECLNLAEALGVREAIRWVDWISPAELRERASRSHLLLGIFGESDKARRVIPNKAFQALALGKPLLTGRSDGVAELLVEGRDVFLCRMADPEDLARAISEIRVNYDLALGLASAGHSTFMENCSAKARSAALRVAIESTFADKDSD